MVGVTLSTFEWHQMSKRSQRFKMVTTWSMTLRKGMIERVTTLIHGYNIVKKLQPSKGTTEGSELSIYLRHCRKGSSKWHDQKGHLFSTWLRHCRRATILPEILRRDMAKGSLFLMVATWVENQEPFEKARSKSHDSSGKPSKGH